MALDDNNKWAILKKSIESIIYTNGNNEITGLSLCNILKSIVTSVGENASFIDVANTSTSPGSPDGPVFYITSTPGIYSNFGGLSVNSGELAILLWNCTEWSKKSIGAIESVNIIKLNDTTDESDDSVYSSLRSKTQFLDKTKPDTAAETITFLKGIVTDNVISSDFISGLLGFKFSNQDGISYGEIDDLMVRRRAIFISLAIKEISHIGGAIIASPASAKLTKVEEGTSSYKCYFKGTDGTTTVDNFFYKGDLVLCRTYSNNYTPHYYWRKCTSTSSFPDEDGNLYIVLSKDDCASGSEAPQAGDTVVTFGSTATGRQSVIILNSEGADAPYFQQLRDVNSFSVTDSNILTMFSATKNVIRGEQIGLITEDGIVSMADMHTAIVANTSEIALRAYKTDVQTLSTQLDGLDERVTTAESSISLQADSITSVVSKQETVGKNYNSDNFERGSIFEKRGDDHAYILNDSTADEECYFLRIDDAKKGDKIHIDKSGSFCRIYAGEKYTEYYLKETLEKDHGIGDDIKNAVNADDYTVEMMDAVYYGDYEGEDVIDYIVNADNLKVVISLGDDNPSAYETIEVTLIRSAYTAESRIEQTAENIKLAVGETGINIDAKTISLSASNTIVSGDLSVQRVNAYDSNGNLLSSYNGNGNGTIIYYYPSGYKMREDAFVYDSNGDIVGMMTIYYKADGSVAWTITETGFSNTLADYWVSLGVVNYTTDETALIAVLKEYLGESLNYLNKQTFSRFVSNSTKYEAYNGKVAAGTKSSETPTSVTLWAGVLVYNVELVSGGLIPTYAVTYEVVTSATNQVSLTVTRKFNMTGWID